MPSSDDLSAIIARILNHQHTDEDLEILRQAISSSDSQSTLKIGKYNVNVREGQDIHIGDRIYQGEDAQAIQEIIASLVRELQSRKKATIAVKHIPYTGVRHFVGRSDELVKIHEKFHQQNAVAISAVAGMGGVGKTELAIKYAREHEADYPGGICWLSARDANLAAGIIQFIQLQMGLEVPQRDIQGNALTLNQQVAWCWQNWQPPDGLVLVVLDDVANLENFGKYLPTNNRFRILITTRLRNLDTNIEEISLDVLSPEEALQLLINIVGEKKVNQELEIAQELCKCLGHLPLGIELIGRYLVKKPPHYALAKILGLLKEQRLQQEALYSQHKNLSTSQRGVLDAFEVSWVELSPKTQQVAGLLSLFAEEVFVWEWVELITQSLNWNNLEVEAAIEQLYQRHMILFLENNCEYYYKIHPLIREFLKIKLAANFHINEIKQAFTNTFIQIAQKIPETLTLDLISSLKKTIPHLKEVVENLLDVVSDENLILTFTGLAGFYYEQGLYALAEPWYEQCISVLKSRLGENHLDFISSLDHLSVLYIYQGKYEKAELLCLNALELKKHVLGENHLQYTVSLNNLAMLYKSQGKYTQAELLYIQALEIRKNLQDTNNCAIASYLSNLALLYNSQGRYKKAEDTCIEALELYRQILGENHPHFTQCLNNLALIYEFQGRYNEAELLYIKNLELRKQIVGENHPNIATSLNNLALTYKCQGRYEEAEKLLIEALELIKELLGENHPHYAYSLENLALVYKYQKRYEKAETLYMKAMELCKQLLGEHHPSVSTNLNNLAELYRSQGNYNTAEPLCQKALELTKQLLGKNHPEFATSLSNLGIIYYSQGRYDEAEPLYIEALELRKSLLGENHPHYATSLNNLAYLYNSQGKYEQAESLYIQALRLYQRVLGENHQNTVEAKKNLAYFWCEGIKNGYFSIKVLQNNSLFLNIIIEIAKQL